jgi:hypothetical protein
MAVAADANSRVIEMYREAMDRGDMESLTRIQQDALADDYVQEWPQSGERIRGKDNMLAINENYSSATGTTPSMKTRRITTRGDLAVIEATIDYGDGTPVSYVGIAELSDGKVKRMTEYFANPFEAPEWRKQYVERME